MVTLDLSLLLSQSVVANVQQVFTKLQKRLKTAVYRLFARICGTAHGYKTNKQDFICEFDKYKMLAEGFIT